MNTKENQISFQQANFDFFLYVNKFKMTNKKINFGCLKLI